MLERHVEIRQHLAVRHQREDVIDVRIGVDVVQPHPDTEFAQRPRQIEEFRPYLAAFPFARGVFYVDAIGRRILGNDQQFLDPGGDQPFGFTQHVGGRSGNQIAAQSRDDAKRAAIVATL